MFRLDVQSSLLRENEEVSVGRAESLVAHRSICRVHVNTYALVQCWISLASDCLQPLDKVHRLHRVGQRKWIPSELRREVLHSRVR